MIRNTAIGDALKKTGVKGQQLAASSELRVLAENLLRGHRNPMIALESFVEKVTAGAPLLVALLPKESIRNEALRYLRTVAADMTGQPERAVDVVKPNELMPSPAGDERGGHTPVDARTRNASPASPQKNGGDRRRVEAHGTSVPAGSQGGSGHGCSDAQTSRAAPAREPTKTQKAAAKHVAKEVAKSIYTQRLGGEITFGTSTRIDWVNFERKGIIAAHVARRMLTEIEWPDDATPLQKCSTEVQVRAIRDSGYRVLDTLGVSNVG